MLFWKNYEKKILKFLFFLFEFILSSRRISLKMSNNKKKHPTRSYLWFNYYIVKYLTIDEILKYYFCFILIDLAIKFLKHEYVRNMFEYHIYMPYSLINIVNGLSTRLCSTIVLYLF